MVELAIEHAQLTDRGRKRSHNEDFVDYHEPADQDQLAQSGRLYIVADGVGGGTDGEIASEYTVEKILYEYYRSAEEDLGGRLEAAVCAANADIFEHVQQRPELGRMGTTVVAAAVRGQQLVVANVGDSRAYLIRDGRIRQITRDHSLVARLVEEGSITVAEAEHHPKRNVLLRSIGSDPDVYPDVFEGTLQPGDQIILCSDGLTRYVPDEEMLAVATRAKIDHVVKQLVNMANVRGGKDNITVMLLCVTERISLSDLADRVAGRQVPVLPEFATIHDTVRKRQEAPAPVADRERVLRTIGGVLGVLVLFGILYVGGRASGIIPALRGAIPTADPTGAPPIGQALSPTAVASPTSTLIVDPTPSALPTATPSATPVPTVVSAPSQDAIPAMDPRGDVETYETGVLAGQAPAALDIRDASVGPDLHIELQPSSATPEELMDWRVNDEVLLWIAFHTSVPVSPAANTQWVFALDLDGDLLTGRPQDSGARINPDLGDDVLIGVSSTAETDAYVSYLWIWDPIQGDWSRRPGVPRFDFFRDRTLIGLAVSLQTLTETVQQVSDVVIVPEAVRGRSAAVSYPLDMIDFYPDLPQETARKLSAP